MRVSTTLKAAGVALALGSLAFLIPPQAGAAGSGGGGDAACITGFQDSAGATVDCSKDAPSAFKTRPFGTAVPSTSNLGGTITRSTWSPSTPIDKAATAG